jgi:hypothetical protein
VCDSQLARWVVKFSARTGKGIVSSDLFVHQIFDSLKLSMASRVPRAARAAMFLLVLVLVLHLPLSIGVLRSGKVAWVLLRRDQAAGDLDAMAKMRGAASLVNCERYRQVKAPACVQEQRCYVTVPCHCCVAPGSRLSCVLIGGARAQRASDCRTARLMCGTAPWDTPVRVTQSPVEVLGSRLHQRNASSRRSSLLAHRRERGQVHTMKLGAH